MSQCKLSGCVALSMVTITSVEAQRRLRWMIEAASGLAHLHRHRIYQRVDLGEDGLEHASRARRSMPVVLLTFFKPLSTSVGRARWF